MDYVVLDTDVASLSFRSRLPSVFARPLAGKVTCVSFVTIAEMTKWAELRDWSPRNRDRLNLLAIRQLHLEYDITVAQTWGRLSAAAQRGGRTAPINDTWIAASCLAEGLPLATLNVKDYEAFAEHHGLTLVTPRP